MFVRAMSIQFGVTVRMGGTECDRCRGTLVATETRMWVENLTDEMEFDTTERCVQLLRLLELFERGPL